MPGGNRGVGQGKCLREVEIRDVVVRLGEGDEEVVTDAGEQGNFEVAYPSVLNEVIRLPTSLVGRKPVEVARLA